jgi:predicted ester cyclase
MDIIEQNKVTIWQMFKAVEQKGFAAQSEFFADHVINHGISVNRVMVRAILEDILTTFPDVKMAPLNIVAERDWVAAHCMFSGTHKGVGQSHFVHEGLLAGAPPTGKSFKTRHIHMFRMEDGLIVEHWAARNDVDMARQLGLLPEAAISSAK